jgi:hypothetical protein
MDTERPAPRMWIDHAVLGVRDLDRAAVQLFERYGLSSVLGGRHPAWGTENRIVPLGESYLELLAVRDPATAERSPVGRSIARAIGDEDHLIGWCVATDDIERVAAHLRLPVDEGERVLPDGDRLRWRSTGFMVHPDDLSLPFFIEWLIPGDRHPGRADAPHAAKPDGIAWVEVSGHPSRLADSLMGSDVPLRIDPGQPAVRRVVVATSAGDLQIP